jgi:hypothetical protein
LSEGVHVVDLCNGPLTVSVLPSRGMGLWRVAYHGIPIGWQSPVEAPVHPAFVDLTARNGLGWLDGFQELLCRCGLASNGPPGIDAEAPSPIESQLTLHGRIANIPAHRVEVGCDPESGRIHVTGVCDESTLFGPQLRLRSTTSLLPGGRTITIRDEVTNLGARSTELELLYHINVGEPLLESGARASLPFRRMCPRDPRGAEGVGQFETYNGPQVGFAEQVYFFEPLADADGWCCAWLRNRAADRGLGVEFRPEQLPAFALWKCTQAPEEGYVTGLEPGTNFPNFKGFERKHGRVVRLLPGQTYAVDLQLVVATTTEEVSEGVRRIEAVQGTLGPTVFNLPTEPMAPGA